MSQAQQSKPPVIDLDTGGGCVFMKWQDYSFCPTWLFHILAHSPLSITFIRCRLLFPVGRLLLVQEGRAESFVGSCCVASSGYQSRELPAKVLGHTLTFVSTCLWSPGSFPTSSIFAAFFPAPFLHSLGSCLLYGNPYFWPPLLSRTLSPGFPV